MAFFGQSHQDVRPRAGALHKTVGFATIDEFDCAVVAASKLVRQSTDGWCDRFRKTADRKQQLILSRFDTGCFSGLITEFQVSPDMVPDRSQCPVIRIFCGLP